MRVIAIDPGPTQSAMVVLGDLRVLHHDTLPNAQILESVGYWGQIQKDSQLDDVLVIEQIANMGMPAVGQSIFDTCFWSGRFAQMWRVYSEREFHRIKRHEVKMHLCHSMRAKDANIRQALIDLFGGQDKAIGRKGAYGPLAGVTGDQWAALAVAYTWQAQHAPTALPAARKGILDDMRLPGGDRG